MIWAGSVQREITEVEMPDDQNPSGLETLVTLILEAESLQQTDWDEIAYSVFHESFGAEYLEAAGRIGLETGIMSFLAQANDWREALKHLLRDRRIVTALANELAGHSNYDYCPRSSDLTSALSKLLDTVKLPVISPPQQFRGRAQEDEFLIRTRQELDDLGNDDHKRFKDLADRGWGELETLTKIVVRFHQYLFGKVEEIAASFENALEASGLNQRLDGMRNIQKKFEERNEERSNYVYQRERIDCQWHLGRPTPFGSFLDGEIEVDLSKVPSRWSIKWQDTLARFDNSKKDAIGITSISLLNYYKANVDFYRHFYAHSNRQEWIHAGSEMVCRSFEAAAEIVQRILDLRLCPDMIIPIAIGRDGFQRRVAFFVHERDLKNDGSYSRRDIRVMFLGGDQFVQLHCVYFCPYPAKTGMLEPFLVPADEVI